MLGEPARIVIDGMPPVDGNSMAEKRQCMMHKHDYIRKILLQEPRGSMSASVNDSVGI